MHLIFNAHSSDEHYNGDCDYRSSNSRRNLPRKSATALPWPTMPGSETAIFYELYFWGTTADFYDHSILEACEEAAARGPDPAQAACDWSTDFEQQEFAVVPVGVDLDAHEPQRTECEQMLIRRSPPCSRPKYEVCWTAIPKHSDVYVTTGNLSIADMDALLASNTPRSAAPCNSAANPQTADGIATNGRHNAKIEFHNCQ